MDDVDRQRCSDFTCERGGHQKCREGGDLSPPKGKRLLMGAGIPMRDHHCDTVALGDDDE